MVTTQEAIATISEVTHYFSSSYGVLILLWFLLVSGKMSKYLAAKYLEDSDETELEQNVLTLYAKLQGYSQQEVQSISILFASHPWCFRICNFLASFCVHGPQARLSYLDYVKSWKIFGSTYYFGEPQNNREFPPEVVLAINAKGILVVDPDSKEFLQEFPFQQVVTWGHSANSFVIVTGNMVRQTKIYFKTDQGKEMNQIVRAYVENMMGGASEGAGEST